MILSKGIREELDKTANQTACRFELRRLSSRDDRLVYRIFTLDDKVSEEFYNKVLDIVSKEFSEEVINSEMRRGVQFAVYKNPMTQDLIRVYKDTFILVVEVLPKKTIQKEEEEEV